MCSYVTGSRGKRGIACKVTETQTEPDGNNDKVFVDGFNKFDNIIALTHPSLVGLRF